MEKSKGTVTAVSQKEGKYGIALGTGNWYNGDGIAPCRKGDEVEITYEVNGQWKNIEQVFVGKSASESVSSSPSDSNKYNMQMSKLKNKTNAKICALTCATELLAKGTSPDVILEQAEQFNKWIYEE